MTVQAVGGNPDFQQLEQQVLGFWKESNTFGKLRRLREGRPLFRFVDGPITANNPMGVHHAWGRTLKDVFLRYQSMIGHCLKYQNGFDCQGLWVEVEVEKALGFSGKSDIEKFGLANFSRQCRARVDKYSQVITEQSIRLGQWMDWDHSYYTHDAGNIVGIWYFLQVCHRHGWIYRKGLPMPWCPRCGTSLSEHEMAGSYREMEHLSLYVHAPLKADPRRHLLLWTTTPWTLAANVAAAINPELIYCEVSSPRWNHTLILCQTALGVLKQSVQVERTFPGSELVGEEYETFFPEFPAQAGVSHRVVAWKAVDAQEGSGIVHIAPGCGKEDFDLGRRNSLPVIAPINEQSVFVEGFGELTGQHAAAVAQTVADKLATAGKLLRAEMHRHSYPACWRCKGELLFRLVDEWFISCEEIRPRMIEAARTVVWSPEFIGKRMEDWLNNMGDWCISRKRYWGLPLPFYLCQQCRHLEVIGSLEELRRLAVDPKAVDGLSELHRPWIDEVEISCPKCSAVVPRIAEVGDCWLDAGIVPYTTLGYFQDRKAWERAYPIEWICEMREQVRLWFYSMLFMGVTLSGRSPYERVLAYERVVSEEGTMFSKTGHMIRFDEAVSRVGADVMRYLYCRQPVAMELCFGYNLAESCRRKLSDLWNIYAFFSAYASLDRPNLCQPVPAAALHITDRWLLARTARMLEVVSRSYEAYDTPAVLREIEPFLEDVSTWYIRVNRRRFWRNGEALDKLAGYSTLLACLRATVTVLAPIVPFLTEGIWQNAVRGLLPEVSESVHHELWPQVLPGWVDESLLKRTERLREMIRLGLNLRNQAGLRIRQPLPEFLVVCQGADREALAEQRPIVQAELNVKKVTLLDSAAELSFRQLVLRPREAGPVLRGDAPQVEARLRDASPEVMSALVASHRAGSLVQIPGYNQPLPGHLFALEEVCRPGLRIAVSGELTVALDTTVTDSLHREGLARDLVRHLQLLRKDVGLEIDQRIELGLLADSDEIRRVIDDYRSYIAEELLAVRLVDGFLEDAVSTMEYRLGSGMIRATMRQASTEGATSS